MNMHTYANQGHFNSLSKFQFYNSEIGNRKTTVFLFLIPVSQIANRKTTHFLFSFFDGQLGYCKTRKFQKSR